MQKRNIFNVALRISLLYLIVISIADILMKITSIFVYGVRGNFINWGMLGVAIKIILIIIMIVFIKITGSRESMESHMREIITLSSGMLIAVTSITFIFASLSMQFISLLSTVEMINEKPGNLSVSSMLYDQTTILISYAVITVLELISGIFIMLHKHKTPSPLTETDVLAENQ